MGWALIWINGFIHVVYTIVLGKAHERGNLSLVYPLARSAPLFVTLWAVLFLKERLTIGSVMGILLRSLVPISSAFEPWNGGNV